MMLSIPLILAALWAIAGTAVAFLPMRLQFAPGLTLLVLAPPLLVWIGIEHGFWIAMLCLFAVLSLFRRPLMYYARKASGRS